jgi:hypothetical protein
MTDDEIKSAIADGAISVISIDTPVFDRHGLKRETCVKVVA